MPRWAGSPPAGGGASWASESGERPGVVLPQGARSWGGECGSTRERDERAAPRLSELGIESVALLEQLRLDPPEDLVANAAVDGQLLGVGPGGG